MREVLDDFQKLLTEDPRLDDVRNAGGVLILRDREEIRTDHPVPFIALIDRGAPEVLHWSSRRRWMPFNLEAVAAQAAFDREDVIRGSAIRRGIEDLTKSVRFVMDMQRFNGKYARVFLRSEDQVLRLVEGNMHLLTKALTFEIVRIE